MKERTRKIIQAAYITGDLMGKNDLDSCASACAFGFLFSFLPLVLMVISLLIRVVHTSSEAVRQTFDNFPFLENIFNFEAILNSLKANETLSWVNLVLGVWIFWMARNLFLYIQKGITRVFHKAAPPRPVLNRLLVFAGEIFLVLGATLLVLLTTSIKTAKIPGIFSFLQKTFPKIYWIPLFNTVNAVPYALLFTAVFLAYRFYTGTKPKPGLCILAAALCTMSFLIAAFFLNMFINYERYNLIYGILGSLIVLLLEVKIFFYLFFVFAQYIFVSQFFNTVSLSYLAKEKANTIERKLFSSTCTQ